MPPRRSAPVACGFASLPPALVAAIFAKLPVRSRLHCRAVSKAWRAALSEPALWARVDLSGTGARDALVFAATALAGGGLQALDVTDCPVTRYTVLDVLRANAAALRELRISNEDKDQDVDELTALLTAAPQLTTLEAGVECGVLAEASLLLRQQPPFGALRATRLNLLALDPETFTDAGVHALAADITAHPS